MRPLKIFVSSTFIDLRAERAAVESALHRLRTAHFVGMEYFGARSDAAAAVSLDELDACDLYVGVIGLARGSGITELEYRRALERQMDCLIYQRRLRPGDDEAIDPRLKALRDEMRKRHVVVEYDEPQELALRLVVDLHREVVERLSTRHESGLVHQTEQAIRLFIAEYSSDGAEPTIFGGREAELRQLDRWLDDPSSPAQAVLTAPAGRGKSALLVNWVRGLAARRDLHVIFFPISIRFGTHLAVQAYATLATRLAALHGESVATAEESATEFWRGLLISLLMRPLPVGVRALVVLDGADEGGDWQPGPDLLPARLPAGIKLLISARHLIGDTNSGGWLERFGWSRPGQAAAMELRPLTPAGVVAVLRSLSVPLERLSERVDVVAELYRLSEGDPLLVKLYVADLWALGDQVSRLQPEDLQAIDPGLEGYFKRWWADQRRLWGSASPLRESGVNDLLNTLACALGPLQTDLLLGLLPSDSGLDLWSLDETLQVLRRFIVGDGRQQGYVFGHPRLADHFYEQLVRGGRASRHEQRFVEWGLNALEKVEVGQCDGTPLPKYVPQFLPRHMERCGSPPQAWARLVSPAWLKAWEPLDRGSHAGFLADLLRAQEIIGRAAAAEAGASEVSPWPLVELRATLYASSLATLAADLSPPLLATLARRAIWTPAQAIAQASRIPGRARRTAALVWLTTALEADFRPLPLAATVAELRAQEHDSLPPAEFAELLEALQPLPHVGDVQHPARLAVIAQATRQLGSAAREALWGRLLDWISDLHAEAEAEIVVLLLLQPWLDGVAGAAAAGRLKILQTKALASPRPLVHSLLRERWAALRGLLTHAVPPNEQRKVTRELMQTIMGICLESARRGGAHRAQAIDEALAVLALLPVFAPEVTHYIGHLLDDDQLEQLLLVTIGEDPDLRRRHLKAVLEVIPRAAETETFRRELITQLLSSPQRRDERLRTLVETAPLLDAASSAAAFDTLSPGLDPDIALTALDSLVRSVDAEDRPVLAARALPLLREPTGAVGRALADVHTEAGCRDSWDIAGAPANPELAAAVRRLLMTLDSADCQQAAPSDPVTAPPLRPALAAQLREWSGDLSDAVASSSVMLLLRPESIVAGLLGVSIEERLRALAELTPFVAPPALRDAVTLVLEEESYGLSSDVNRLISVAAAACAPGLRPAAAATLAQLDAAAREVWAQDEGKGRQLAQQARATALPDSLRELWAVTALRHFTEDVREVDGVQKFDADVRNWIVDDACCIVEPGIVLTKAILAEAVRGVGSDQAVERWCRVTDRVSMRDMLPLLCEPAPRRDLWRLVQAGRGRQADTFWSEVLEAAAQHPSEPVRSAALEVLATKASDAVVARSYDVISQMREPDRRIEAVTLVADRLPADVRARVLNDVRSMLSAGAVAVVRLPESLVRLLGSAELAAEHLSAQIEAALGHAMSERRQQALLELEARLDDVVLGAAVTRLQRLDDLPARLQAIRALALRARGGATELAALQRLRNIVGAVVSPAARSAAVLACSSLLPAEERWKLLLEALADPAPPSSFDVESLAADLAMALHDAPAAVCGRALDWITHQNSIDALRFVVRVGSHLPPNLLWLAHSRVGGSPETWDRLITPAARAEMSRRRREPPRSTRRLLEEVDQLRTARRSPTPDQRHPQRELALCLRSARSELTRSRILREWALGRHALEEELPLAMEAFETLGDPELRDTTLAYMALWTEPADRVAARRALSRIPIAADRSWALLVLATRWPVDERAALYDEAFDALREEADFEARMPVAVECALRVPARIDELLPLLVAPRPEPYAVDALAYLLPRLPDTAADVLLHALPLVQDSLLREHLISSLVPLPGGISAATALSLLADLDAEAARARVLSRLASSLPDALRTAAESALDRLTVDHAWLLALRALGTRWPTLWTEVRLQKALSMQDALGDDEDRCLWLDAALPHWPAAEWPSFVRLAAGVHDSGLQGELLAAAVRRPDIERSLLRDAISAMTEPYQRAVALGALATLRADDSLWPEVITGAIAAGGQGALVEAATVIAKASGRVPEPLLEVLISRQARWHPLVVFALEHLAPWFDADQVRVLRGWTPFAEAAARLWPELDDVDESDHGDLSHAEFEAAREAEEARAAQAAELAAAVRSARRRLAAYLAVDVAGERAGETNTASEASTRRALDRLLVLESMADRLEVAMRTIVETEAGRVGELMRELRHGLDAQRWGAAVEAAWDRWVGEDTLGAVDAALGLTDSEVCLRLLARTPRVLLQPARARLHVLWQQRLALMRRSRRAEALAELAELATLVECLGGEPALLQAMDDIESACVLWP